MPVSNAFGVAKLNVASRLWYLYEIENGQYKMKNKALRPHFETIKHLAGEYRNVTFTHVLREYNKLADAQVNLILDKQSDK